MTSPQPSPTPPEDAAPAQLRVAVAQAREALAKGDSRDHQTVRAWLQALAEGRREPGPGQ